jgi:tetratricopeptide (TPR) repeat protein
MITGTPHQEEPRRDTCPDGETPEAYSCKAMKASRVGDNAKAAQLFEQGAALAKSGDTPAKMLAAAGNLWIAADHAEKAAAALDKALAMPGLQGVQRGEALLDRARAAEAKDELATARAKVNEASALIEKDPFLWYFSAGLAMREGDRGTAQTSIAAALKIAPKDPTILFEAGHVSDFIGDDDQARRFWTRAAESDPNGPVGKAAAKAVEMLGVTPVVKTDPAPAAKH